MQHCRERDLRWLRSRLMGLVKGQWPIARCFLRNVKARYPERPVEWYLESIIYDLERDRGL